MSVLTGLEESLINLIQNWYLATGYLGIVIAMTLESCGIPLPSEIVMPLAGFFVFTHPDTFSLVGVALAGAIGCVIGSAIAYWIGATGGRPLLLKYGKYILISKADADRADLWFAKYGNPVAFFSRLMPVIRTYISFPAGIARMNFWTFTLFTFLGSLIWSFALAWIGFAIGQGFGEKDPSVLPRRLGNIFHGLDVIIIVLLAAGVGYYIYRHIKHDREARAAETSAGDRVEDRL
jgi:membrane protein DedA with SNARE-associated domain